MNLLSRGILSRGRSAAAVVPPNSRTVSGVTDPEGMSVVYQFRGIDVNGNQWWSTGDTTWDGTTPGGTSGYMIVKVSGSWLIIDFSSSFAFEDSTGKADPTLCTNWAAIGSETGTPVVTRP